ncbi:MAG: response regulator [Pseudobutyrivibrio sp.]|nr:response regulator [Pseudobutyrivibrio sp.]
MGRDDSKTIPIIALTANAFDEDVQHSLQAGMNAHLSKPIDTKLLFETLDSICNNR